MSKQVFDGCSWIDVGGAHSIFPDNPALDRLLVSRCSLVVAVDTGIAAHFTPGGIIVVSLSTKCRQPQ